MFLVNVRKSNCQIVNPWSDTSSQFQRLYLAHCASHSYKLKTRMLHGVTSGSTGEQSKPIKMLYTTTVIGWFLRFYSFQWFLLCQKLKGEWEKNGSVSIIRTSCYMHCQVSKLKGEWEKNGSVSIIRTSCYMHWFHQGYNASTYHSYVYTW